VVTRLDNKREGVFSAWCVPKVYKRQGKWLGAVEFQRTKSCRSTDEYKKSVIEGEREWGESSAVKEEGFT
jgi:hypothetical protein